MEQRKNKLSCLHSVRAKKEERKATFTFAHERQSKAMQTMRTRNMAMNVTAYSDDVGDCPLCHISCSVFFFSSCIEKKQFFGVFVHVPSYVFPRRRYQQ